MANQPSKTSALLGGLGVLGIIVALVAAFFVSGEDTYPGRFFIERQAYWNGGTYYVKFTFLSVLLTLANVFVIPGIIIAGLMTLMEKREESLPPSGWDVAQTSRRFRLLGGVIFVTALWAAYTGAAIIAPELLKPAGFIASTMLIFVPIVPMGSAAFFFEALIAPRYVEGPLEAVWVTRNKNVVTVHVMVGGKEFQTQPGVVEQLPQGTKLGLVVSGFFKTVLRLERRG